MDQKYVDSEIAFFARNPRLVEELRKRGVEPNPQTRFQMLAGSAQDAAYVGALVASMPHTPDEDELGKLIRLLGGTHTPYDAQYMIDIFIRTQHPHLKRDIMHSLMLSHSEGCREFLMSRLTSKKPEEEVFGYDVAFYLQEHWDGRYYLEYLMQHDIPRYHYCIFRGLYKRGRVEDLPYLRRIESEFSDQLASDKYLGKEFAKVLRKLTKMAETRERRK